MHKLVILIESLEDWQSFEAEWPRFLHLAENMPGLRMEAISRVENFLYGNAQYMKMHELFFDSLESAEGALSSSEGQAAGQLLHQLTGGRMTLFIAEHKQDDLKNIQRYKESNEDAG